MYDVPDTNIMIPGTRYQYTVTVFCCCCRLRVALHYTGIHVLKSEEKPPSRKKAETGARYDATIPQVRYLFVLVLHIGPKNDPNPIRAENAHIQHVTR